MNPEIITKQLEKFNPKFGIELAAFSTWQIGGPAEILIITNNSTELEQVLKIALELDLKTTILGWGSNVLISDAGIEGLVIINKSRQCQIVSNSSNSGTNPTITPRHTHNDTSTYDFRDLDYDEDKNLPSSIVEIDSGVDTSYAIAWSHKNNLTGLQFFSGIPGTIGGALYNNIHGGTKHLSDRFVNCTCLVQVATKPRIITVCGPGGVGKNTLIRRLVMENSNFVRFTTTTTRAKRDYEIEGNDYNYINVQEFKDKIENNQMVEFNELFPGVFYGTDRAQIQKLLDENKTILFDIDYHGADALAKEFSELVLRIFVLPPSLEELKHRMQERGDAPAKIIERMEITKKELVISDTFDYTFVNDNLETCYKEIFTTLNQDNHFRKMVFDFEAMNFGYDKSNLRSNPNIFVLKVALNLQHGNVLKAKFVATEWAKRKRTQPRISCGSVFQSISLEDKNRLGLPTQAAGYIIDKIFGLKGYTVGGVQISPNHGNFIINIGGGKASEVLQIIQLIQKRAKEELSLVLHPEINFLGEFES